MLGNTTRTANRGSSEIDYRAPKFSITVQAGSRHKLKGRSTDGYLWAAVNSERQLRSAAQRQHAAERVGAEGQRRAQHKEAAERAKQEKSKTELELGQQPTCPCMRRRSTTCASTARAPTASKYIVSVARRPSLNGTHRRRAHCGRQRRRWCSCKRP